jgi:transposase|tara:strand:- start:30 stop:563 length:534 start_codon:yes stop_codon:yes gene_type:complete
VQVWAQDEMRTGLQPILRRSWSPVGKRPIATCVKEYDWCYVYGFVRPATGDTEWLIMPTVNTNAFSSALKHFAKQVGASKHKKIVLVLDGAGWHRSKDLVIPDGIHLVFQPAYSPEVQPSERLWPLIREAIANLAFSTIYDLEDAIAKRCNQLSEQKELLKSYTLFHWWKDVDPIPA